MNLIRFIGTRRMRQRALPYVKSAVVGLGGSWNDFYAWMLDLQDRGRTLDEILSRPPPNGGGRLGHYSSLWHWQIGEFHARFMMSHDLQPHHTVLDFGCGYGRAAMPLLRYLEPGKYVGVEISKRRLALAREWVEREGLGHKQPRFVCSKDNGMPYLQDNSVDVVWALAVFNHMPDNVLEECLRSMNRVLRPNGLLFCYFTVPNVVMGESVKNFYRTQDHMEALLARYGFGYTTANDWPVDSGPYNHPHSAMLLARKR